MKVDWQDLYRFNTRLGLYPLLGGIPYFRYIEYPIALDMAGDLEDKRILDIGSGRRGRFPLFLLTRLHNSEIYSTDINDYHEEQYRLARKLGKADTIETRFFVEKQDATCFTYPDDYFDIVFSISTLEHIVNDGDSRAAAEICRILRPDGTVVISVPFDQHDFRDVYCYLDVSFQFHDKPIFFERHYNRDALQARIIDPSGLEISNIVFFGEPRFKFWEHIFNRILILPYFLQWISIPLRALTPLFSNYFLSVVSESDETAEGVILKLNH